MADDYLATYAVGMGNKPAIIDDRPGQPVRTFTFAELHRYSDQVAHAVHASGVRPGDKVLWCGANSIKLLAFTHAARKAGCVAVPLNYRLSPEEAAYVTDNSDAVFAWVDAEYADLFAAIAGDTPKLAQVVVFDGEAAPGQRTEEEFLEGVPATPPPVEVGTGATMIYTSGTTGKPKGAVRTNSAASGTQQAQALLELIGYGPGDVYLTTGPLYHSGPGGFMRPSPYASRATPSSCRTQVRCRKTGCVWSQKYRGHFDLRSADSDSPHLHACRTTCSRSATTRRARCAIMVANAAPWSVRRSSRALRRPTFPKSHSSRSMARPSSA